jgi:hypothetical protein
MIESQHCYFSAPVEIGTTTQFSEMTCFSSTTEQITGTTTDFYLNKVVSYGDFLIIFFLFLFSAMMIFNFIFKFIFKQKVSFRNQ